MRYFLFALGLLGLLASAHAQSTAILEGNVRVAGTATPLQGAHVILEELAQGTTTDAKGRFQLANLPAGTYTLTVRFLGFVPYRQAILLQAGVTTQLTIILEEQTVSLGEIVVAASGLPQSRTDVAASVGLLRQEAMASVGALHPAELLNRLAGVWLMTPTGEGHLTAIRQPLTTEPVYLYLENGVPIRSTGFFNHNALYEVNLPQAEAVEVIKGPGTALYGSDAIGAVVNVSTPPAPDRPLLQGKVEGGSYGYGRALLSAGTRIGAHRVRMDANVTRTDGWREATRYARQSVVARWDWGRAGNRARLSTVVSFSHIDQNPAGSSALSAEDFERNPRLNYTPISYRRVWAFRLSAAYAYQTARSRLELTPYVRYNITELLPNWSLAFDPAIWDLRHRSLGLMVRYHHELQPERLRLTSGIDLESSPGSHFEQRVRATRQGKIFTAYTLADTLYDYYVTFWQAAPYAQLEVRPLQPLEFSLGLRLDWARYDYDNRLSVVTTGRHRRAPDTSRAFVHASPKLGWVYRLDRSLTLFGSYRHAFRVPSEGQLFRQGATSNTTHLAPVRADQFELGIRGALWSDWLAYELVGYQLEKRNDIVSYVDAQGVSQVGNVGRTRHRGLELSLRLKPTEAFQLEAAWSYTGQWYVSWETAPQSNLSGNELELAPRVLASLVLSYTPSFWKGSLLLFEWRRVGSYWMDAANTVRYEGYHVANMRLNLPLHSRVSLSGRVLNLWNRRYAERATYHPVRGSELSPAMPRSIYLSLQYHF